MAKVHRNPRVMVAFEPTEYELLKRLAQLQDTTMSKVVRQFFQQVEPVLREVVAALEAAAQAKGKPAAQLLAAMADLQTRVEGMTQAAVDQADMFAGRLERTRKNLRKAAVKAPEKRKRAKAR